MKTRLFDLIQNFEDFGRDGDIHPPRHSVGRLFVSAENKFSPVDPSVRLQGLFTLTEIKQERTEVPRSFAMLDAARVHFVVISGWSDRVLILTQPGVSRDIIEAVLGVHHDEDALTFERNA